MITPSIYKIKQLGLGTLYIMPKPSGEWLDEDIRYFASIKITKIVSLLQEYEVFSLGLSEERVICNQNGIEFVQFEIKDRGVPNMEKFRVLVTKLSLDLKNGENIAIHCRAGVGRAGLLSSCILNHYGIESKVAIEEVSSARIGLSDEIYKIPINKNLTPIFKEKKSIIHNKKSNRKSTVL